MLVLWKNIWEYGAAVAQRTVYRVIHWNELTYVMKLVNIGDGIPSQDEND